MALLTDCETFVQFLQDHSIDLEEYHVDFSKLHRHIRINPHSTDIVTTEILKKEFPGKEIKQVEWVDGFYAVPSDVSMTSSSAYKDGRIYGLDASSGFAVSVLDPQPGQHVLDLCCAPGAKFAMIADRMDRNGTVVGVDASSARANSCRKLLYKYGIIQHSESNKDWNVRLYCADGTKFKEIIGVPSGTQNCIVDTEEMRLSDPGGFTRVRKNKSAKSRERKRRKLLTQQVASCSDANNEPEEILKYDRVLIDAECTHDGSWKHLHKYESVKQVEEYVQKYLGSDHVDKILAVQFELLRHGFELLKKDGILVYSTCSLSKKQNEEIVSKFLKEEKTAKLVPIDLDGIPCREGDLAGTVRFSPLTGTSGLFVAKLVKIECS